MHRREPWKRFVFAAPIVVLSIIINSIPLQAIERSGKKPVEIARMGLRVKIDTTSQPKEIQVTSSRTGPNATEIFLKHFHAVGAYEPRLSMPRLDITLRYMTLIGIQ